jgi:hypothetical protein
MSIGPIHVCSVPMRQTLSLLDVRQTRAECSPSIFSCSRLTQSSWRVAHSSLSLQPNRKRWVPHPSRILRRVGYHEAQPTPIGIPFSTDTRSPIRLSYPQVSTSDIGQEHKPPTSPCHPEHPRVGPRSFLLALSRPIAKSLAIVCYTL